LQVPFLSPPCFPADRMREPLDFEDGKSSKKL
jgi:hypothetical protein